MPNAPPSCCAIRVILLAWGICSGRYFDETGIPAAVLRERALAGEPTAMQIVLGRAVARGEIEADRLSPRIASLPLDLVRHDVIMNRTPVADETLVEIVDRLFLPLVLAGRPQQKGQA